ncbi:hypothetical protein PAPYR_8075 [Paratrimastix pyriformis]|uniref:Uncharacterized protein n=1 Tax=Paratrimastix pyriformis TaxID=342808 RepID=A0ABQ8UBC2_9EUKA|nr:hypothetical protein PAPYR_8075 [Paratrimastix pyriformis]
MSGFSILKFSSLSGVCFYSPGQHVYHHLTPTLSCCKIWLYFRQKPPRVNASGSLVAALDSCILKFLSFHFALCPFGLAFPVVFSFGRQAPAFWRQRARWDQKASPDTPHSTDNLLVLTTTAPAHQSPK